MTNSKGAVQAQSAGIWLLYVVSCLWLGIALVWWSYSRIDYGYGFWYDQLDIGNHIRQYASRHPVRHDFARLSKDQHLRAFESISHAVHNHGEGLTEISFSTPEGTSVHLLDRAEVLHLQDVAKLINWSARASLVCLFFWLGSLFYFYRQPLPPWRFRVGISLGLAITVSVLLVVAGPRDVFYQMHIWVFPPEHQWFFYWEQSLMSCLMKAPDLFGGIAVVLAGIGLPVALLLYRTGLQATAVLARRRF